MANQTKLPNNCRYSQPTVFPKNYLTGGPELLNIQWYITYRFYDDNLGQNKKIMLRDFNKVHTLKERRTKIDETLTALSEVLHEGENPFHVKKRVATVSSSAQKFSEKTPFFEALNFADSKVVVSESTRQSENKFFLPRLIRIAEDLNMNNIPVGNIQRKHIKELLERCGKKNDGIFSEDQFNRYRKILVRYYRELLEWEMVESNLPFSIQKKKPGTKIMRATLEDDQRREIDNYLAEHNPSFRAYIHCFYHSGARSSEMLRLKVSDIDFKNQRIKFLIKKGIRYAEVFRPIPDIAVKYWESVIAGAPADHYIFSEGLIPGLRAIRPYQITKRFYRLIKDAKNRDGSLKFPDVKADFYSLKHSKVSDLADEVGIDIARGQFAENVGTLNKHYDGGKDKRNDSVLKRAGKEFA